MRLTLILTFILLMFGAIITALITGVISLFNTESIFIKIFYGSLGITGFISVVIMFLI